MTDSPSPSSPSPTPSPSLLTVQEFSRRAGVSTAAVYKRLRLGKLRFVFDTPRVRFMIPEEALTDFSTRQRKTRRVITTSYQLDEYIKAMQPTYGDISAMFEQGAWLLLMVQGKVAMTRAVDYLSNDVLSSLTKFCEE